MSAADYFEEQNSQKCLHYFCASPSDETSDSLMVKMLESTDESTIEVKLEIDFSLPSFHKSIATPDGSIYLIGGTRPDKGKSDVIYKFQNGTLVEEADRMKEGRSSFGVCYLRNSIYVVGGIG